MGSCECARELIGDTEIIKPKDSEIQEIKYKSTRLNILYRMKRTQKLDDSLKSLLFDKFGSTNEELVFSEITREEYVEILKKNKFYQRMIKNFKEELNCIRFEEDVEYENVNPIKVEDCNGEIQYYQGSYNKEGKCHGFGIWSKDGDIYFGNFKDDEFSGQGLFINKNGGCYFGKWCEGKCNGKGQLIINDIMTYEGEYNNNKKEGKGIENFPDGGVYVGTFKGDQRDGKGKYIFPDGSIYEGNFKESQCDGFGKIYWSDGKNYIGKFSDGKINGRGEYTYKNGVIYSGGFENNKKQGDGEYKWPDGKMFQGKWINNKLNGDGIFIDINNGINEVIHYKEGKINEK